MLEKSIGKVHVAIDPVESLASIERLDDPDQYILFHMEGDFFRDERDWEEGFRLEQVDGGVVVQNASQKIELSDVEYALVHRYFMQYRQGLIVA